MLVAGSIYLGLVARPAPVYATADGDVSSAGQPGDPGRSARAVNVTVGDADGKLMFDPALVKVRLGEQIKFVVTNAGQLDHEFFLGTPGEIAEHTDMMKKFPDMEHNDANVVRLKPGETKEIVWHFTKAGDFEYACLLPGHLEAGMVGKVAVE
jgi:uncharacterized cupredoxin-like copper-binding protein